MIIRKWTGSDNLPVSEIEKQSFSDPWTLQMIVDTFMQHNFLGLVAEVDGVIVGYIALTYCMDEAEINIIAVSDAFRRKGIATNLLEETYKALKKLKVKVVFLEVRRSNEQAQSLYEKQGFNYVAVRPNYYKGLEDALVMSKILKE